MDDRKISILHIASDEKFIDAANYIFEKAFPGSNHFVIPKSSFNQKLIYIKTLKNVEVIPYNRGLIYRLSRMTQNYNCVFLHGITELNSTVFLSSIDKDKFIGILWGAELYSPENFPERSLIGEITGTIKLREPEPSNKEKIKNKVRRIFYSKQITIKGATKLAASCLSYFGLPYKEEYDFLKGRKLFSDKSCYIPFTYYPFEYIMKGNELSIVNGNDILLGNSADFTNNHLEAFKILKNINIGNRKIVVPLSYGNALYADYIQTEGFNLFNGSFRPLLKFMPLDEYTREIQSCGIVVMNHFRQQAVGNILSMLYLGSKVYLNESNTFFHYLKRIGIKIYSIEKDLRKENKDALRNLAMDEIEQNRIILKETNGEENVIGRLKEGLLKYFS